MLLQDIKVGQNAYLELVGRNQKFDIQTRIVAVTKVGVIVLPYEYQGVVVDISSAQALNAEVSLQYVDHRNNQRVMWKNVRIQSTLMNGKNYYFIQHGIENKYSNSSERRAHERIPVGCKAVATDKRYHDAYTARIVDINARGIAFQLDGIEQLPSKEVLLHFDDRAHGKWFSLDVDCHVVRHNEFDLDNLYGCTIDSSDGQLMTYMFLKRMDYMLQQKERA